MSRMVDVELIDGLALLRPNDDDLGPEQAEALRSAVKELGPEMPKAIIINFSLVEYISSIFLSALVELFKEFSAKGIKFGLAELNRNNLEVIKTTKLHTVFPVFSSVQDACAAFK